MLEKLLENLPNVINDLLTEQQVVDFSLFRIRKCMNGSLKMMPHSNTRKPHLLSSAMMSKKLAEMLAEKLSIDIDYVNKLVDEVTVKAKSTLAKGDGSSFVIQNMCIIYTKGGRIRVSSAR